MAQTKRRTLVETCCQSNTDCETSRPRLEERALLTDNDALKVSALFRMLSNDTRIRLLHHLVKCGEATVSELANILGMKPQAVSNQLTRLSDTGIVHSRRQGNNVYYRVANGCVAPLLDLAICLIEEEPERRAVP